MPPRYLTLQKIIAEDPQLLFDKDLGRKKIVFYYLMLICYVRPNLSVADRS
jgi:hypothetical protein